MSYTVQVAPAALGQLRKLPPDARRRIQAAIELLAETPRPPGAKKLVGSSGNWRVRTGDYRIIYEIRDAQLIVLVVAMATGATSTSRDEISAIGIQRTGVEPGARTPFSAKIRLLRSHVSVEGADY